VLLTSTFPAIYASKNKKREANNCLTFWGVMILFWKKAKAILQGYLCPERSAIVKKNVRSG